MYRTLEISRAGYQIQCTEPLPVTRYREIVEHMMLHGCKWDAQVGDVAALAPFAITIDRTTCAQLFGWAEVLTAELIELETAIAHRPDLWPALGLPLAVRRILDVDEPWTPSAARIVRYDFHPTTQGWRISEVNSDVPGGMNEATRFTEMMASELRVGVPAGAPMDVLADSLTCAVDGVRRIAGVAAPGLLEDQQVVESVAAALRRRGVETIRVTPDQLRWDAGEAFVQVGDECAAIGAVYRFFQGEWMRRVQSCDWRLAFRGGKTPVCNPGTAVLTESKRLPLVWNRLGVDLPTWRELLPRTSALWAFATHRSEWVRKGAYSNAGEDVCGSWSPRGGRIGAVLNGIFRPRDSIAQQRFWPVTLRVPDGPVQPCLGVYVINGAACGIYGRITAGPVIDYRARDVAVLVLNDS